VTRRMLPVHIGEVRILGAREGTVRAPAYSLMLSNRFAYIEVVVVPLRPLPHRCSAQRRSRPSQRSPRST
jgi:hypothetical protein